MKPGFLIGLTVALPFALPLSAFAGFQMTGTPDLDSNKHGDLQAGYTYQFAAEDKSGNPLGILGLSSEMGEWWVAKNSGSPWDTFVPDSNTDKQPSFHLTDQVCGGESFYVGLSMEYELSAFTSSFRMANDLFPEGTDFYFGVRGLTSGNDVLLKDAGGLIDPDGGNGNFSAVEGLVYEGASIGLGTTDHAPTAQMLADNNFTTADQFEWVHYTTDAGVFPDLNGDNGDIIFTLKSQDNTNPYVAEWIIFILLPELAGGEEYCIGGDGSWGDAPPQDADALDSLVFSWTVNGIVQFDQPNPGYNDPNDSVIPIVPEPSAMFLAVGAGAALLLLRRNRKPARGAAG